MFSSSGRIFLSCNIHLSRECLSGGKEIELMPKFNLRQSFIPLLIKNTEKFNLFILPKFKFANENKFTSAAGEKRMSLERVAGNRNLSSLIT